MREHVRQFVDVAAATFQLGGPVYEFGSYQVEGQDEFGDLRSFFPGESYTGCDFRPGPGVDRVEDITNLSLDDAVAKTIVCVETLEHVYDPLRAVSELIRVLAPGGVMLISTPFEFHIHDYPSDYWRLTPSCYERMLSPLAGTLVGCQGPPTRPHTVYGIGIKAPVPANMAAVMPAFVRCFQDRLNRLRQSVGWTTRCRKYLGTMLSTKRERRRQREYYRAGFQYTIAADQPPEHDYWRPGRFERTASPSAALV